MKRYLFLCLLLGSCGQQGPSYEKKDVDSAAAKLAATSPYEKIPEFRDSVQSEPVTEYSERTENPLNEWYFSVKIFETKKTFHYLMKLQYEEMKGEDILKLPNTGTAPKPVIQKGPDKYSCIVGFMDMNNQFREYKKVYVTGNHLKITALKHYATWVK